MSASYEKSREELHIFRVVNMNERWEDSKLVEYIEYELYAGDDFVCCADSLPQLVEKANYLFDESDDE